MAKSLNRVTLLGNVGKDPEIKYTPNGTVVARLSLATNERYKDKGGEWQDRTEWHSLILWRRLAEIVGDYVKKGSRLYLEGKLETSSWDDKQSGDKRYRTDIVVKDLWLLGDPNGQNGTPTNGNRHPETARGEVMEPHYAETGITDEDIPF